MLNRKEHRETGACLTNIKGLPEGRYMTRQGYSQSYPYKVVGESPSGKTRYLVDVLILADPEWKPEMYPGGFCAYCANQSEQTWLYDRVNAGATQIAVRKRKNGTWGRKGERFHDNRAIYFYDYNF